uniref:Oxidative stress induced growth inhibitor 1 n=1 Tax=Panthera tigris altaica TaxID=74533 RepID=A0A8C9K8S4_PANTA
GSDRVGRGDCSERSRCEEGRRRQYPVAGKCLHDTQGSPSGPSSPPDQLPAPSPPPAPAMNSHRRDHLGTDRSEPLPVLIIGNGPSGICLSYLLSGYTPYVRPDAVHPHPLLQRKLAEAPGVSLLDQDLDYLSEGLEGRCQSPVALLFDALLRPDTDFGGNMESVLTWKHQKERAIPHMVLGRNLPGGAWHVSGGRERRAGGGSGLSLPGPLLWLCVLGMVLSAVPGLFFTRLLSTEVQPTYRKGATQRHTGRGNVSKRTHLHFSCPESGTSFPAPEGLLILVPSMVTVPIPDPFLLPGGDLSFPSHPLPKMLYPEYHKVHQMMREQSILSRSPYGGYLSLPEHRLLLFKADHQAVFRDRDGLQKVFGVALVLVLIGSHPDLSFLPGAGADLAMDPDQPLSAKRNPIDVDPFTYQSTRQEGLYAVGPLAGDNFVRFVQGGALAVASSLLRKEARKPP